jgi:hypothetical protein
MTQWWWPAVIVVLGLGTLYVAHRCLVEWLEFRREAMLDGDRHDALRDDIVHIAKSVTVVQEELNSRLVRIENQVGIAR